MEEFWKTCEWCGKNDFVLAKSKTEANYLFRGEGWETWGITWYCEDCATNPHTWERITGWINDEM